MERRKQTRKKKVIDNEIRGTRSWKKVAIRSLERGKQKLKEKEMKRKVETQYQFSKGTKWSLHVE